MLNNEEIKENNLITFHNTPFIRTIIDLPIEKRYKLLGFLKHEIFEGRVTTSELKNYVNVKQITFLFK